MRKDFRFFNTFRVRYAEIDGQGIVFNAHYMNYAEISLTEYLRHLGLDYVSLVQEGKMDMALVKSTLEFKASAYFDELLDVGVRVTGIGSTSFTVMFEMYRNESEEMILKANNVYVNYNVRERRADSVPDFFRRVVAQFEGGDRILPG
jgi:acyl-CoA thioester hydrolase